MKRLSLSLVCLLLGMSAFVSTGQGDTLIEYQYDDLNRLERTSKDKGSFIYTYDEVGNITQKSIKSKPVLSLIGSKSALATELLTFGVSATDADSEVMTYLVTLNDGSPLSSIGASFTDNTDGTGQFSWTPSALQGATSEFIRFKVEDSSGFMDQELIEITVYDDSIVPDVTVNNSDGPITFSTAVPFNIKIALNPGNFNGVPADWWVWAEYGSITYWFSLTSGWVESTTPILAHDGDLMSLSPYTVLNETGLPTGTYIVHFDIDNNQDGVLDATYSDQVVVTLE